MIYPTATSNFSDFVQNYEKNLKILCLFDIICFCIHCTYKKVNVKLLWREMHQIFIIKNFKYIIDNIEFYHDQILYKVLTYIRLNNLIY